MNPNFKDLGMGVGLRPTHHNEFHSHKPSTVSWVEVISENFMPWQDRKFRKSFQNLKKIRQDLPVALHGVSLNLGSTDKLDFDYLARLKMLIDEINPEVVSDHLSWTGVRGENLHDLLPIPYNNESLILVSEKIDAVQNFLGRTILVENPSSYLEFKHSTMSEWEFISQLLKISSCGLLLDVNNVFVSSVNHQFDPKIYLKHIPSERVAQIHLAGHSNMNGYLIDTHDSPICPEVWDLYRWTISQLGPKSTMIERDGNIPEWHELETEIVKAKGIRDDEIKKSF